MKNKRVYYSALVIMITILTVGTMLNLQVKDENRNASTKTSEKTSIEGMEDGLLD